MDRVARAAGILEGEGCFRTRTKGHAPIVSCQMTDLDVLEELQDLFGGTLHSTKTSKSHHKPAWKWTVQGDQAESVMRLVYPYMFKRRQLAIKTCLEKWQARKAAVEAVKENNIKAARAYQAGEGSLREVAKKYNTSYESVRRYISPVAQVVRAPC